ncbi:MAG TPA: sigma-54 dependent transcriptional regulator [Thermodesulfobacteriota bacterium]|nr:sigma-54 dependent transcriptional regulator [Thermodesulfobacteriota bacterium]
MDAKGRVLIVDDEADMVVTCQRILERAGFECLPATDAERGLALLEEARPDVVLTDLRMPGSDGLAVLARARELDPDAVVIVVTAYATIESAVEAVKAGAWDYLAKPFGADQLRLVVERAMRQRRLAEENRRLRDQLQSAYRFEGLVGKSRAIVQVLELVRKAARAEANILIQGESGTGKELVARAIHANSPRATGAFVPVDCAALPETLLESELFGHERGAFTGAVRTKPGLFEAAHGGTLFLDEIGELPMSLQAKLLRALQERQVRRVGGTRLIPVDVRLVSATNRDLAKEVAGGRFREDLFYRVNVIRIDLPPLRERKGDVALLAYHFLRQYAATRERPLEGVSPQALERLEAYDWPGNVRELQNVIERACALAEGPQIEVRDLPEPLRHSPAPPAAGGPTAPVTDRPLKVVKAEWIRNLERQYLVELLARHGGNISQAARAAGTDRKTIHRLLTKHGITGP